MEESATAIRRSSVSGYVHEPTYEHRALERGRLRLAAILTGSVMVLEVVGGFLSNSLALLSDAGHMLTHLLALGMSFFAIVLAARPATKDRTYGYYRAEILAAFFNGITLSLLGIYILYRAALRFISPEPVGELWMLLVAAVGLVANGVTVFLLLGTEREDINVRSALLHVIGDTASSVVVVGGAVIIRFTGAFVVDPIVSGLISVLILVWALRLLRDSLRILMEFTPKDIDVDEIVKATKESVRGVRDIHDIHVWVITSNMYSMTAHVLVDDISVSETNEMLGKINRLMRERFKIGHTNVQFECVCDIE